jgi:hypothetical protein
MCTTRRKTAYWLRTITDFLLAERAGMVCDHDTGGRPGRAGPVDAQAGNPADREREIASDKGDAGRDTPAHPRRFDRRPEAE